MAFLHLVVFTWLFTGCFTTDFTDQHLIKDNEIYIKEVSHNKKTHCNEKCGTGFFHAAGMCEFETGRCLCEYGFTGPNSKYESLYINRITADHCSIPCHYTSDYRNEKCVFKHEFIGDKDKVPQLTHSKVIDGKPHIGFPPQHPHELNTNSHHDFIKSAHDISPFGKYDPFSCHWKCGYGEFHAAGQCHGNGKCLCWWGFTGKGATYIHSGHFKGRIVAYHCDTICHYTHDFVNPECGYTQQVHNPKSHVAYKFSSHKSHPKELHTYHGSKIHHNYKHY